MSRIAVIEKDKCHPDKCGNYLCIRLCPVNRSGVDCIVEGEDKKAFIYADTCTGCGICPNRCPFDAITIVKLPDELTERCFHRYEDANGFRLYRSPVPVRGKVVGLLGQNGTGKTTALNALAGQLKPNLGNDDQSAASKEELSKFFAGSELQAYFTDIENKKIALKPQYVDTIPQVFEGTARDLLKKSDERGILNDLIKNFGLENCIDNDIKELSGGELQKAAIAATIAKNADIYFFDEPSSYLDVRERLRVAMQIRELAKDKLVLIVEHDLIILDYLTDLAHVFYGKPGAYGIVSLPKSSREGINEYLGGMLTQENVRFRETPIKFLVKTAKESKKRNTLVSFNDIQKKFDNFELNIPGGEIKTRETVGILGPNATGKTTFMKILAGVEKSDQGSLSSEIKIAYKPQYIKTSENQLVRLLLKNAPQRHIKFLGLESLLDKMTSQLSGGELQRVAVLETLAKDADLYLLDEPSAHLDVEQRVNVAHVIQETIEKKSKSALVIDHDIMFLDYLSDRLMVFLGEQSRSGEGHGPVAMHEGMNLFLKDLGITFRRDQETGRPRANKEDSVKDREQKKSGEYYYLK